MVFNKKKWIVLGHGMVAYGQWRGLALDSYDGRTWKSKYGYFKL